MSQTTEKKKKSGFRNEPHTQKKKKSGFRNEPDHEYKIVDLRNKLKMIIKSKGGFRNEHILY